MTLIRAKKGEKRCKKRCTKGGKKKDPKSKISIFLYMIADCGLVFQSLVQKVSCGPVAVPNFFCNFVVAKKGVASPTPDGHLHSSIDDGWTAQYFNGVIFCCTHFLPRCRRSLGLYTNPYRVIRRQRSRPSTPSGHPTKQIGTSTG